MSNYNPAGGGLQYRGTRASAPPNCTFSRNDPTIYDRFNFSLLDFWLNTQTKDLFVLVSLANQQAQWEKLSSGAVSPGVFSTTGNDGVVVFPNAGGNLNIVGAGAIHVTGSIPTFTETISVDVATDTVEGVTTLANNALAVAGTNNDHAVTPASLAAKLGTQTLNGIAYGQGIDTAIAWTAASTSSATVPAILLARTSGVPSFGTLISSDGTVDFAYTDGAQTIDITTGGANIATVQTVDATPTALYTLPVLANRAVTLYADIIGAKADYSAAIGGNVEATARRAGGGLTMVGVPVVNLNEDSAGAPDFTIVVSGNDLVVQVTGEALTTYNWRALIREAVLAV